MNDGLKALVDRLEQEACLTEQEYAELIRFRDAETVEYMSRCAARVQRQHTKNRLAVMGTVDLSTYCKSDCYYCGFRRDNRFAARYRMTEAEVLECCRRGMERDIHLFLLQGGEDLQYTPEQIGGMIAAIRRRDPGAGVFLALGEKSRSVYRRWKHAGASGYILRHETAQDIYYKKLHPANMSLLRRKQCLWELKELGYLVGSGFMVGSPYQRIADLAKEFLFLRQLMPQLLMVGPFLPMEGTPFEEERNGNSDLTCFLLSLLRLSLPGVILPVAQTLELLDPEGALHAVKAGADLLLADLTPAPLREQYHCYKKRLLRGNVGVEALAEKEKKLREAGYEMVADSGRIGTH